MGTALLSRARKLSATKRGKKPALPLRECDRGLQALYVPATIHHQRPNTLCAVTKTERENGEVLFTGRTTDQNSDANPGRSPGGSSGTKVRGIGSFRVTSIQVGAAAKGTSSGRDVFGSERLASAAFANLIGS
jgi:hypothetical protein